MNSRRTVKLTQDATEALQSHLKRQLVEIDKAGDNWQENGLVFCTGKGTLINPINLRRRSCAPLLQRAGLPTMTFHQLRHTAATILLLKNVNLKVVSEMLGHATIAITLDTYSHVLPNMQHSAIAAMRDRGHGRSVLLLRWCRNWCSKAPDTSRASSSTSRLSCETLLLPSGRCPIEPATSSL